MSYTTAATKKVIEYIKKKYNTDPEFLWAKTPNNSIFRNKDNNKWYAALLTVSRTKLRLPGDDLAEVLNLKLDPVLIGSLRDGKSYLPGYHMNKEHWISVLLDGSVPDKDIFALIDISYKASCGCLK